MFHVEGSLKVFGKVKGVDLGFKGWFCHLDVKFC